MKAVFVMGAYIHPCVPHDKPEIMKGFLVLELRIGMLDDLNELKTFRAIFGRRQLVSGGTKARCDVGGGE